MIRRAVGECSLAFCPAQDGFDELVFCLVVAFAVVPVLLGQGAFQPFVGPCVLRMCAQLISERDVPDVFPGFRSEDIEVMRNLIGWTEKCFATWNTEVTSMLISQRTQLSDCFG